MAPKADPKAKPVAYDDLKPSTVLLARVKGYAPWPAMVCKANLPVRDLFG